MLHYVPHALQKFLYEQFMHTRNPDISFHMDFPAYGDFLAYSTGNTPHNVSRPTRKVGTVLTYIVRAQNIIASKFQN